MIILQTGVPGSGKTASVVNILMTDETYTHFTDKDGQKKKRPLFVNGIEDLQLEHQLLTDEQIKEQPLQDFLPYGSLVVIDEAQRLMGNRPAASKVPPSIEALATHRHHGLDIVLITQHPSFIDPFVRKLVQRHMHISIKPVGRKIYEWNECVDNPDSKLSTDKAIERQFILPKKAFGQYKSAEVHTKVSRRFPRMLVFLIVFIPCLVWFGYYYVGKMKDKYSGKPETEVSAAQAASDAANPVIPGNGGGQDGQAQIYKSLTADMYVPTLAEKPESKPIYDEIRQVRQFERIAGCIDGGKSDCTCYSDQATKIREISVEQCKKYVNDGLPFDPFREPEQQEPVQTRELAAAETESGNGAQVDQMGGQPLPSLSNGNSKDVANIQ